MTFVLYYYVALSKFWKRLVYRCIHFLIVISTLSLPGQSWVDRYKSNLNNSTRKIRRSIITYLKSFSDTWNDIWNMLSETSTWKIWNILYFSVTYKHIAQQVLISEKVSYEIRNNFRIWLSDIWKTFRKCYDTSPNHRSRVACLFAAFLCSIYTLGNQVTLSLSWGNSS